MMRILCTHIKYYGKKTRTNQYLTHKEITELSKFGECLVSLVPGFVFFVPLAIEEHKDQNKQHYIYIFIYIYIYIHTRGILACYFAQFEKLVCHINARAAYVKNVQD
jgi:hypothetical protein